jgi:hypothetical protein
LPCALALVPGNGGTRGLDGIGSGAKLVRGDVRDDSGLTRSVGGMPWRPTQVSGRAHCMAARGPSLGHGDVAARPGASGLDRLTWPPVVGPD